MCLFVYCYIPYNVYKSRTILFGGRVAILLVDVKDLNFSYGGFSIKNVTFTIEKNTRFSLIGNNGSGKTTILRLLVGLLKAESGTIKIFDKLLTRNRQELWEIRKQIGFLFQNPDDQLFAPTLGEDIAFGARNLKLEQEIVEERVNWALEAVDLLDFREKSPFELSWGQKKRAALAGLLVMKPKLLILDEPFANLDLTSIKKHINIFESLMKETDLTILFTTHNMFFVENWAEKMLVIDEGKSVFEGDPIEGLKNPDIKNLIGSYDEILEILKDKI